ncbi:hypothetical protein IV51_GL000163 [Fructilactobacillus fructivorans]|nr:hypothetical protein IV51_GL000163 [Fructilactobacillus fructivorans]
MKKMEKFEPLTFQRILLTVDPDDSKSTQRAFRYSVTMAIKFKASLGICSVLENNDINIYDSLTPSKIEAKRDQLREVVGGYADCASKAGVEDVTPIISVGGSIDDEILDSIAPKFKADLLICGADATGEHGNRSISVKLVKKSKISTIIIR